MTIRVSESYMANLVLRNMQGSIARVVRYQQMASSLRRINSYADDPRAIGAINKFTGLIERNDQYVKNVSRARVLLESTDGSLQSMIEILADVRELVLRESSALADDSSQDNAVVVVDETVDKLLGLLNTTVEGNSIFGGHRIDLTPFVRDGDSVVYQGDAGEIQAQIGPNLNAVVNVPGSRLLGSSSSLLSGRVDLAPPLTLTTNLVNLNLGEGWQPGLIEIEDGNGVVTVVNLSTAGTVADVINRIDQATGGAVTAEIGPDGRGLQLNGDGPLTVREVAEGTTAQSLGLNGYAADGFLLGRDIRTVANHRTRLSDIESLQSALPLGEIVVEIGGVATTVDFSTATTIDDLLSIFNGNFGDLELQVQGALLTVVNQTAEPFTIRNADGSTTATDLGLAGTGSPARLVDMLFDLKAALAGHDQAAILGALPELEAVQDLLSSELIRVGSAQQLLDHADAHLRARDERLQAGLSRERDADVSDIAVELGRAENAYQATLMATSRLLEFNLMDYLR